MADPNVGDFVFDDHSGGPKNKIHIVGLIPAWSDYLDAPEDWSQKPTGPDMEIDYYSGTMTVSLSQKEFSELPHESEDYVRQVAEDWVQLAHPKFNHSSYTAATEEDPGAEIKTSGYSFDDHTGSFSFKFTFGQESDNSPSHRYSVREEYADYYDDDDYDDDSDMEF